MSTSLHEFGFHNHSALNTDLSGMNTYYRFDSIGYINYNLYNKHHYLVWATQSSHPAGGQYWRPFVYRICTYNTWSGSAWQEQWHEQQAGPADASGAHAGKYRTGSTYSDALNENWSDNTYYFAWHLNTGGGGTAAQGLRGYIITYSTAV